MIILDGRKISEEIKNKLKHEISKLDIKPGLAIILIGNDAASKVYISSKVKACQEIGYYSEKIILPETVSEKEIFQVLERLNNDKKIHGILVQLPLPKRLAYLEKKITEIINPLKDVDCIHPINVGKFFNYKKITDDLLIPCTPKGIITLLKEYNIEIEGKNIVVCGRSNLVGKPISILLCNQGATVTITHSKTKDLFQITSKADILISAIGKDRYFKKQAIKDKAVVIDVGINRSINKIYGDVDFDNVKNKVKAITPVPGGVGPMTIASLMENVFIAYKRIKNY